MTKTTANNSDRYANLLPWYVNGTLDAATTEAIDKALETDADLRLNLERALEDQVATAELAELDTAPQSMSARFDAQLERELEAGSLEITGSGKGLLEKLGGWLQDTLLAGSRPRLALATVAAAIIILLQSGAIVSLFVGGQSPQFDLASDDGDESGANIVFLVQLNENAVVSELSAYLDKQGGRILDGPLPGGMYKLGFENSKETSADSILAELKVHNRLFKLILPQTQVK